MTMRIQKVDGSRYVVRYRDIVEVPFAGDRQDGIIIPRYEERTITIPVEEFYPPDDGLARLIVKTNKDGSEMVKYMPISNIIEIQGIEEYIDDDIEEDSDEPKVTVE